jgi:uncharacterized protein involved in outer membrane biogenesis
LVARHRSTPQPSGLLAFTTWVCLFTDMRRLLLAVAVVVVVLFAVCLVALRSLAGGAGKDRIATALSGALGMPVAIGEMSVSVLPTPALDAGHITIGGADSAAAPSVSVRSLHVVPNVLSFLPGRTRSIDRVDLIGLVVAARRDKSGKWLIPVPAPAPQTQKSGGGESAGGANGGGGGATSINLNGLHVRDGALRVVDDSLRTAAGASTVTTITAVNADLSLVNGALTISQFTGRLGQTVVTGSASSGPTGIQFHLASASIDNADLPSLFALAGMRPYPGLSIGGTAPFDMTSSIGADLQTFTVTGTAAFQRLQLGTLALQDLKAPFKFDKKIFTLDPLSFTLYKGREQGRVAIDMGTPTPSYTIRTTIVGLDVNEALSATTTMKNKLLGTARLSANVRASGAGEPEIEKTLAGTVGFGVINGTITGFPLLAKINDAVHLAGGSGADTKFDSLTGTAAVGGGKARTNDLLLRAGSITVNGKGTYGFDQSLNFQLSTAVAGVAVPVTVTGTASSPHFGIDIQSLAKKQLQGNLQKGLGKLLPH